MTKFSLTPQRSALLSGHDNEFHILAKLKAPKIPINNSDRKNLNLSIVIDQSGSMSGLPLEEAKKCAIMIVDNLNENDRLSVVTYGSNSEVIIPSTKLYNKRKIKDSISKIYCKGMTALYEGWLTGAEQVARHKKNSYINRILLLSDGQANVGPSSSAEITPHCSALAETGVSTSTYGLGNDFNEELMISMSKSGMGKGYYGQTANDLEDPFREEFELLSNIMATNIEIFVEYPDFVKLELLNGYNGKDPRWNLPDLAYEGEAWALFKLSIAKENLKKCLRNDILKSHLTYRNNEGQKVETQVESIKLKTVDDNAFGAILENSEILSRIEELSAASYQDTARNAALQGNWEEVNHILSEARNALGNNAWIQNELDTLENYAQHKNIQSFSKEAYYSSDKFRNRLSYSDQEISNNYCLEEENIKPMYLRRKFEQGKKMFKNFGSSRSK